MADEQKTPPSAPERERPRVRVTEESPRWQQVLRASSAFLALTEQQDPPLEVRYYSNRVEIPAAQGATARRLYALITTVLEANGVVPAKQTIGNRTGLTVRIAD